MSKIIIIIIILVSIVGYGAYYCLSNFPLATEDSKDEISLLLEKISQQTGIDFPQEQETEIQWMVKKYQEIQPVTITGKRVNVRGLTGEQHVSIRSFFETNGFAIDIYNVTDGTISGSTGYSKGQVVCIVIEIYQELLSEDKENYLEIKCGKAIDPIEPLTSREETIKEFFAKEYKTKLSAVNIEIKQETESHVKGLVEILDQPIEMRQFLAAKVNGDWEIITDIEIITSCPKLEKYDFPQAMIKDCFGLQTIKTKAGDSFSLVLTANPTTGYQWKLDLDPDYIELINREYIPYSSEVVGSGGEETFNFNVLKAGETEMVFYYARSWEEGVLPREKKVFRIIIE